MKQIYFQVLIYYRAAAEEVEKFLTKRVHEDEDATDKKLKSKKQKMSKSSLRVEERKCVYFKPFISYDACKTYVPNPNYL